MPDDPVLLAITALTDDVRSLSTKVDSLDSRVNALSGSVVDAVVARLDRRLDRDARVLRAGLDAVRTTVDALFEAVADLRAEFNSHTH